MSYFCLLSVYLVLLACDLVYLILFITFHYTRWYIPLASLLFFVLSCMPYMHQKFLKKKFLKNPVIKSFNRIVLDDLCLGLVLWICLPHPVLVAWSVFKFCVNIIIKKLTWALRRAVNIITITTLYWVDTIYLVNNVITVPLSPWMRPNLLSFSAM